MKYYVKNMVCSRCIMMVEQLLDKLSVPYLNVQLGEIGVDGTIDSAKLISLNEGLNQLGFYLIDDRKTRVIEKIKTILINMVHHGNEVPKQNMSVYLSEHLHYDYNYLSSIFSEVENITIEKFIINQKIERVKELLVYDELNLTEIAEATGYSSASHLSNQFKKITGLTPGYFKKVKENKRKSIDEL